MGPRGPNEGNRRGQIAEHPLGFDANDGYVERRELAVTTRVRGTWRRVIAAISPSSSCPRQFFASTTPVNERLQ